jgi:hypothetical protein
LSLSSTTCGENASPAGIAVQWRDEHFEDEKACTTNHTKEERFSPERYVPALMPGGRPYSRLLWFFVYFGCFVVTYLGDGLSAAQRITERGIESE